MLLRQLRRRTIVCDLIEQVLFGAGSDASAKQQHGACYRTCPKKLHALWHISGVLAMWCVLCYRLHC